MSDVTAGAMAPEGTTMRILYVTGMWSALESVLAGRSAEPTGMPAFFTPLFELASRGHRVVLLVGFEHCIPLERPKSWPENITVQRFRWRKRTALGAIDAMSLLMRLIKDVRRQDVDFVYGQGPLGTIACVAARLRHVPSGQRLYGTFLANELKRRGKVEAMVRHPLEYFAFRIRKGFLLVTNDGTRADVAYKEIGAHGRYAFHFKLNGRQEQVKATKARSAQEGVYLYYPARIAPWKRQHLAVETLHELRRLGHKDVRLLLAGEVTDPVYLDHVNRLVGDRGLREHVEFLGALPWSENQQYTCSSFCMLSMYEVSNLGNSLIEAMALGSIVVSMNDGSLAEVIQDGENGVLVETPQEAAGRIDELLRDPFEASQIRDAALRSARERFPTWETRASWEADLVERAVAEVR